MYLFKNSSSLLESKSGVHSQALFHMKQPLLSISSASWGQQCHLLGAVARAQHLPVLVLELHSHVVRAVAEAWAALCDPHSSVEAVGLHSQVSPEVLVLAHLVALQNVAVVLASDDFPQVASLSVEPSEAHCSAVVGVERLGPCSYIVWCPPPSAHVVGKVGHEHRW